MPIHINCFMKWKASVSTKSIAIMIFIVITRLFNWDFHYSVITDPIVLLIHSLISRFEITRFHWIATRTTKTLRTDALGSSPPKNGMGLIFECVFCNDNDKMEWVWSEWVGGGWESSLSFNLNACKKKPEFLIFFSDPKKENEKKTSRKTSSRVESSKFSSFLFSSLQRTFHSFTLLYKWFALLCAIISCWTTTTTWDNGNIVCFKALLPLNKPLDNKSNCKHSNPDITHPDKTNSR